MAKTRHFVDLKKEYIGIPLGVLAVGIAGAFIFKKQICEAVDIPFLCDSGVPAVRSTPNCSEATNMCACPTGEVFQMGPARTCKDCTIACVARAKKKAMYASYYGYY